MNNDHLALQKQILLEEAETYSTRFSDKLKDANHNLQHFGVKALLTLGAILATYYLARGVFKGSRKKAEAQSISSQPVNLDVVHGRSPSMAWTLYDMVKQQLMVFLLALLRQKLAEYLETLDREGMLEKLKSFVKTTFNPSADRSSDTII